MKKSTYVCNECDLDQPCFYIEIAKVIGKPPVFCPQTNALSYSQAVWMPTENDTPDDWGDK